MNNFFSGINSIFCSQKYIFLKETNDFLLKFSPNINTSIIDIYSDDYIIPKHLRYKFNNLPNKSVVNLLNGLKIIDAVGRKITETISYYLIILNPSLEVFDQILNLHKLSLNNSIINLLSIINEDTNFEILTFNNSLDWFIMSNNTYHEINKCIYFSDPIENSLFINKNIKEFNDYVLNKLKKRNYVYNLPFTNEYFIANCSEVLNLYSENCTINIKNICTISTEANIIELKLFLLSLNLFWSGTVYIGCDSFIDEWINNNKEKYLNLIIKTLNILDKYKLITTISQHQLNKQKEWLDLMLEKTTIIEYALNDIQKQNDDGVLFLDSDIVILHNLPKIPDKDIVLSIHNCGKITHKKVGFFNGGCIYVKNKKFPQWWKNKTFELKDKVYMEQGTLSYIETNFIFGVFTDQFNFGYWRYGVGDNNEEIKYKQNNLIYNNNKILYDNKPLLSIHTHFFCDNLNASTNMIIMEAFNKKILELINEVNDNKLNIIKEYIEFTKNNSINSIINNIISNKHIDINKLKSINYNNKNINKAIFICLDCNCIKGLIMVLQSILNHNDKNKYVFNILCEESAYVIVLEILNKLFYDINYNVKIFDCNLLYKIDKYFNNSCGENPHCKNAMNYARFFYELYFDENYYLYIDTDIIFNGNIDHFFTNIEYEYIKVVLNLNLYEAVRPKLEKIKYIEEKYNLVLKNIGIYINQNDDMRSKGFNAGIYCINNLKNKENDNLNKIITFMNDEYDSFYFGTQPVVNIFYHNILSFIENNYMVYNDGIYSEWNNYKTWTDIDIKSIMNNFEKFKSIHVVGKVKPWEKESEFKYLYQQIINTIKINMN